MRIGYTLFKGFIFLMRQDIKNQSVFIYFEKYAVLFINSEKKIINSFYLLLDIVGC